MKKTYPKKNPMRAYKTAVKRMSGNVEPRQRDGKVTKRVLPSQRFSFTPTPKPSQAELQSLAADGFIDDKTLEQLSPQEDNKLTKQIKKYKGRILIMNFIFLILALGSIFSLLFLPFAQIKVQIKNDTVAKTVNQISNEKFNSAFNGYLQKSDIINATKDVEVNFELLKFSILDFLKLGIDKNLTKTKEILVNYIQKNWVDKIGILVEQATPAVLALSARMAISMVSDKVSITAEQFDSILNAANSALTNLEAGNVDGATTDIMSTINPILTGTGVDTTQVEKQLKQALTIINNNAKDDNNQFSINAIIGNLDKIISEITAMNKTTRNSPTAQTDKAATNKNISDVVSEIITNITNPQQIVDDIVNRLTEKQQMYLSYGIFGFGIFTCISAALWAFLALRILIRFMCKNKAVSLWSVIWFGGLQGIWMIPWIVLVFLKLTSIVSYLSWTWISLAASFITMLLYFIVYRRPKKHLKKIRKHSIESKKNAEA